MVVETGAQQEVWDAFEALIAQEATNTDSGPDAQPSGAKGYNVMAESDQVIGKLGPYVAPYNPEAVCRFISEGA